MKNFVYVFHFKICSVEFEFVSLTAITVHKFKFIVDDIVCCSKTSFQYFIL